MEDCTQVIDTSAIGVNISEFGRDKVGKLIVNGTPHDIYIGSNTVGRDELSDVVLRCSSISLKHAVVEVQDPHTHLLYDCGSTNKTRLGTITLKPEVRYFLQGGEDLMFADLKAQYFKLAKPETEIVEEDSASDAGSESLLNSVQANLDGDIEFPDDALPSLQDQDSLKDDSHNDSKRFSDLNDSSLLEGNKKIASSSKTQVVEASDDSTDDELDFIPPSQSVKEFAAKKQLAIKSKPTNNQSDDIFSSDITLNTQDQEKLFMTEKSDHNKIVNSFDTQNLFNSEVQPLLRLKQEIVANQSIFEAETQDYVVYEEKYSETLKKNIPDTFNANTEMVVSVSSENVQMSDLVLANTSSESLEKYPLTTFAKFVKLETSENEFEGKKIENNSNKVIVDRNANQNDQAKFAEIETHVKEERINIPDIGILKNLVPVKKQERLPIVEKLKESSHNVSKAVETASEFISNPSSSKTNISLNAIEEPQNFFVKEGDLDHNITTSIDNVKSDVTDHLTQVNDSFGKSHKSSTAIKESDANTETADITDMLTQVNDSFGKSHKSSTAIKESDANTETADITDMLTQVNDSLGKSHRSSTAKKESDANTETADITDMLTQVNDSLGKSHKSSTANEESAANTETADITDMLTQVNDSLGKSHKSSTANEESAANMETADITDMLTQVNDSLGKSCRSSTAIKESAANTETCDITDMLTQVNDSLSKSHRSLTANEKSAANKETTTNVEPIEDDIFNACTQVNTYLRPTPVKNVMVMREISSESVQESDINLLEETQLNLNLIEPNLTGKKERISRRRNPIKVNDPTNFESEETQVNLQLYSFITEPGEDVDEETNCKKHDKNPFINIERDGNQLQCDIMHDNCMVRTLTLESNTVIDESSNQSDSLLASIPLEHLEEEAQKSIFTNNFQVEKNNENNCGKTYKPSQTIRDEGLSRNNEEIISTGDMDICSTVGDVSRYMSTHVSAHGSSRKTEYNPEIEIPKLKNIVSSNQKTVETESLNHSIYFNEPCGSSTPFQTEKRSVTRSIRNVKGVAKTPPRVAFINEVESPDLPCTEELAKVANNSPERLCISSKSDSIEPLAVKRTQRARKLSKKVLESLEEQPRRSDMVLHSKSVSEDKIVSSKVIIGDSENSLENHGCGKKDSGKKSSGKHCTSTIEKISLEPITYENRSNLKRLSVTITDPNRDKNKKINLNKSDIEEHSPTKIAKNTKVFEKFLPDQTEKTICDDSELSRVSKWNQKSRNSQQTHVVKLETKENKSSRVIKTVKNQSKDKSLGSNSSSTNKIKETLSNEEKIKTRNSGLSLHLANHDAIKNDSTVSNNLKRKDLNLHDEFILDQPSLKVSEEKYALEDKKQHHNSTKKYRLQSNTSVTKQKQCTTKNIPATTTESINLRKSSRTVAKKTISDKELQSFSKGKKKVINVKEQVYPELTTDSDTMTENDKNVTLKKSNRAKKNKITENEPNSASSPTVSKPDLDKETTDNDANEHVIPVKKSKQTEESFNLSNNKRKVNKSVGSKSPSANLKMKESANKQTLTGKKLQNKIKEGLSNETKRTTRNSGFPLHLSNHDAITNDSILNNDLNSFGKFISEPPMAKIKQCITNSTAGSLTLRKSSRATKKKTISDKELCSVPKSPKKVIHVKQKVGPEITNDSGTMIENDANVTLKKSNRAKKKKITENEPNSASSPFIVSKPDLDNETTDNDINEHFIPVKKSKQTEQSLNLSNNTSKENKMNSRKNAAKRKCYRRKKEEDTYSDKECNEKYLSNEETKESMSKSTSLSPAKKYSELFKTPVFVDRSRRSTVQQNKSRSRSRSDSSQGSMKSDTSSIKSPRRSGAKGMKVQFTSGIMNSSLESQVKKLGGSVVDCPVDCSLLVADKVRRTVKFLCVLGQGKPIVSLEWINQSWTYNSFVEPSDHLLVDEEAEEKFNFSLSKTIKAARNQPLLSGYHVHATPSVKPPPEDIRSIVECCGGCYIEKIPTKWPENCVIVSHVDDKSLWKKFKAKGVKPPIVASEMLLIGVLQHKIEIEPHRI